MMFPRPTNRGKNACAEWHEPVRITAFESKKSLFECHVRKTEWALLRNRLLKEIDPGQDSLRFYHLDEDIKNKAAHHGINEPADLTGPLVL